MPPRRRQRQRDTPADEHVSETDAGDGSSLVENDENTPINDENAFSHDTYAPVHRSSSVLALRTPLSHARTERDTPLRDITDQFFHPPSPSPIRVSKPKRSGHNAIEPPRRPKKPKSLGYPADPPNWLHSHPSSSLPPSSPFPPSTTNVDHHLTSRAVDAPTTARYEYELSTPSKASDSDPFGFIAVERELKAKQPLREPTIRISGIKSPPRTTVLPSAPTPSRAPGFGSFSQLDAPIPTNNEDIEGLYVDEPVAGPSHVHVPVAPLLLMNSDQPYAEVDAAGLQPTFPDPLRTPRKRKRRVSPTPDRHPDSDSEVTSVPSSPSPVKVSVGPSTRRRSGIARSSDMSALKVTRPTSNPPAAHASRTKRVKTSYQDIPTPSSTPVSVRRSSRQSTIPPTPVPPRRSTRHAAVVARARVNGTTNSGREGHEDSRMKLRSRSPKVTSKTETKTKTKTTVRVKPPSSRPKGQAKTPKAAATTAPKSARGRPKSKSSANSTKGKGKGRLENVLDLSDDTRERYEKERRERLEYFKRLEEYQIQKENVYVV